MGKHVQQHHSHLEELQQTEHMISRYLRTNLPILVPRYIIIFPNCRFFNLIVKMKWVGQLDAYSILALTWVHFLPSIMVVYRSRLICQEVIFFYTQLILYFLYLKWFKHYFVLDLTMKYYLLNLIITLLDSKRVINNHFFLTFQLI